MPERIPVACRCGGIIRKGVCSKCGPRRYDPTPAQAAYDAQRGSSSERGYDVTWQRLRRQVLYDHPYCVDCQRRGMLTMAEDVDHIVAMADGGARLDPANLQPLCRACHNRKTRQDARRRHG